MVYCPKCGTQNEDTAQFCIKCGANLKTGTYESRYRERRRAEGECFGLPNGGAIVGLAIGLIIVIWGLFMLAQQTGLIERTPDLWFLIILVIGVLILAGAIYKMRQPRTRPTY